MVARAANGVDEIEERLSRLMRPIHPDPEFVDRLKTRLTNSPVVTLEERQRQSAYLILTGGLFFGALLIWMLHRLRG